MRRCRVSCLWPLVLLLCAARCYSQTTQSLLWGRVRIDGEAPKKGGLSVACARTTGGPPLTARINADGFYYFLVISPGTHVLTVQGLEPRIQNREIRGVEVPVAGTLRQDIDLQALNKALGEYRQFAGKTGTFNSLQYGPDINGDRSIIIDSHPGIAGTLDTSVSYVVQQDLIDSLPLLGRDVYSLLVLLPEVTAATTTSRGLNLSVAGERPSSSNFLLDGLEYNNYLITGPLAAVIPESIQEYRISASNYSAEYGRTSGFIANAVTRSGSIGWHGSAFAFWEQEAFDANNFQENTNGIARPPLRQAEPGGTLGGPLIRDRLFTYTAVDVLRYHSQNDPEAFLLPTQQYIASTDPDSPAGRLLRQYGSIAPPGASPYTSVTIAPPTGLHRDTAVERIDYNPAGKSRLTGRITYGDVFQPDLLYNPYPGFSSGLTERTVSVGLAITSTLSQSVTNEARIGRDGMRYDFDRPHAEIPALNSADGVSLPGSQAYYGYGNRDHTWEALDDLAFAHGRHLLKAGGGWLGRGIETGLSLGSAGYYDFPSLAAFQNSMPADLYLTYNRATGGVPQLDRSYRYQQAYGFLQDSFQVFRKLSLNFGLRYEFFGTPFNTGPIKDTLIQLSPGTVLPQGLASASFFTPAAGEERVYSAQTGYWAPRAAFAWTPGGGTRTVLRGGYGIYYDRPFDNFWETVAPNALTFGFTSFAPNQVVNFLAPPHSAATTSVPMTSPPVYPVLFQPRLRNGSTQDSFLELERDVTRSVSAELLGSSALGRTLATNDLVNRYGSTPEGQFNPDLSYLYYRANQGKSDYFSFSSIVKFRSRRLQGQASYTLSHAIDNQSDPLAGGFLDYNFAPGNANPIAVYNDFTRQFDSQFDRGNADFDQRQNLVFYVLGEIPAWHGKLRSLATDWHVGVLAAFRSGFPYSVYAQGGSLFYVNNRADLKPGFSPVENLPVRGGEQLLNPDAFALVPPTALGQTGRNAFTGSGLYNIDVSLMREFHLPRFGESKRIQIRADAFNFLNHANLNIPINTRLGTGSGCDGFAVSCYGRIESSGSPLLQPLLEGARQVQVMLRFSF